MISRSRISSPTTCNAGFTLLEMLIAMTLLAIMLSLLYGGLRLSARSWDAGENRAAENAQAVLVQNFLRRQISQITPMRWKAQATGGALAFNGEQQRLRFIAPISAKAGLSGLYLVSLEYRKKTKSDNSGQLILRHAALHGGSNGFSELDNATDNLLADQVKTLEFSYFGAENNQSQAKWLERWEQPAQLPLLIRLRVSFVNEKNWPELVVAPLIGNESGCIWNNQGNLCIHG